MQPDHSEQPDTPHPHDDRDPRDGAAVIAPVTDAMMDHAAHEAAALVDGVARGGTVVERAAEGAAERGDRAATQAVEAAGEATQTLAEAADDASDGAVRAVEAATRDAGRAAERGTEAARDALSASTDALAQYNAKVIEVMRSNMASTSELFAALVQAKSVPEALSLNADHFRRRMEALTTQGRELATLAQRIAFDAMQPFKGAADR